MRIATLTLAAASGVSLAAPVNPFTEAFTLGNSNWRDSASVAASWDASGFVSGSADVNSAGAFGLIVFRAQDEFGSSNGAFVGDYVAGNIDTISFDIRHNAGLDLSFAVRFSTVNNSPAFVMFSSQAVASGEWTTVTLGISPTAPGYTPAGGTYETVANQIGHVQILVTRPDGLAGSLPTQFDLDNVAITPAPGALALLGLGGLAAGRRRRA